VLTCRGSHAAHKSCHEDTAEFYIFRNMDRLIHFQDLKNFAKQLEGKTLTTKSRKKNFIVNVLSECFEYTPLSTNTARKQSNKEINKIIERYNETHSIQPKDYHDVTYSSVYILTIIEDFLGAKKQ
jgi:hypothetical protein